MHSGDETLAEATLARQPRQHVFKLRQFYLQTTFRGSCTAGKDIQNQLRAVNHANASRRFQIALLRGRQFVVNNDDPGFSRLGHFFQFGNFAAAQQRGRSGFRTYLKQLRNNFRTSRRRQFRQFAKRLFRRTGRGPAPALKPGQNCFFGKLLQRDRGLLNLAQNGNSRR